MSEAENLPDLEEEEEIEEEVEPTEEVEETEEESEVDEETEEEEEYDTVEINGKEYQVPKSIKDGVMMQADYTRKTQEVAEQRKQLEAEKERLKETQDLQQRHFKQTAQLANVDDQLEQYEQVDWQKLYNEDANLAQQHQANMLSLQNKRQKLEKEINQLETERQQKTQEETQERILQGQQELEQMIQGWSPEEARKTAEYMKAQGLSDKQLAQLDRMEVMDAPRIIAAFHKSMKADQRLAEAKKKGKETTPVKPSKKVQGKGKPRKDLYSDNLTPEERIKLFRERKHKK